MLYFTDKLLLQKRVLQDANKSVNVHAPPPRCCTTPPPPPLILIPFLRQTLQQSIDHALQAVRAESEEQLRATAEFIMPKWPQLRSEITRVRCAAKQVCSCRQPPTEMQVLSSNLSPEEKKLQKQRLQQLRKHIKDAELDLFLAGCCRCRLPFTPAAAPHTLCSERAGDVPRQEAADAVLQQLREELGWLVAEDADRSNAHALADDDDAGGDADGGYSFTEGDSSTAFTAAHGEPPKTQRQAGETLEEWWVVVVVVVVAMITFRSGTRGSLQTAITARPIQHLL
jgi:hypothetical protein